MLLLSPHQPFHSKNVIVLHTFPTEVPGLLVLEGPPDADLQAFQVGQHVDWG